LADALGLVRAVEAFDRDGALSEVADALSTTTRRAALGLAAGTALGWFGGAAAGSASGDEDDEQDDAIVNYVLGLEYLQASFHSEAETWGPSMGRSPVRRMWLERTSARMSSRFARSSARTR